MNCIVWNYRGLGNPRSVQELTELVRNKDPEAVFVMKHGSMMIDLRRLGVSFRLLINW